MQPTVHHQGRAGDERRFITGEPERGPGDLLRGGPAAQQVVGRAHQVNTNHGLPFFGHCVGQRCMVAHGGVVDQDVKLAMGAQRVRHSGLRGIRVCNKINPRLFLSQGRLIAFKI